MDKPCKYESEELCINADCPMCADFCPVSKYPGVYRFEDREIENKCSNNKTDTEAQREENGDA